MHIFQFENTKSLSFEIEFEIEESLKLELYISILLGFFCVLNSRSGEVPEVWKITVYTRLL